jgi:type II secretory ATPase GspE/PulE/Tfp pilus assembly ATPase PilB-like protein
MDVRQNEELITKRRAAVLGMNYADTTSAQKTLYPDILPLDELYSLKIIPLNADPHHIHFGVTTTTSQQTLQRLISRFTDQKISFSIISESGYQEYMNLYNPPKKVEYDDISINQGSNQLVTQVSQTLESVRPDDMLAYLVQQAYSLKASDIHLETQKESVRVRFRVDGVLHTVANINPDKYRHMIAALASRPDISAASTR